MIIQNDLHIISTTKVKDTKCHQNSYTIIILHADIYNKKKTTVNLNMNPSINRKLVIFGGNGFLGKRICQIALQSGIFQSVTAFSRSGKPPLPIGDNKEEYPYNWMKEVKWRKADIFDPTTYKHHLYEATDVVDTIGILLENTSYKSIINGASKGVDSTADFTYKRMNTESAVVLAKAFQEVLQDKNSNSVKHHPFLPTFTYISADDWCPLIPSGYIKSKREAEWRLSHIKPELFRPIFVRPGIMFDENAKNSCNIRDGISDILSVLNFSNQFLFQKRFDIINRFIRPPVSTQQVARSIISKIDNSKFTGIVTLEDILEC